MKEGKYAPKQKRTLAAALASVLVSAAPGFAGDDLINAAGGDVSQIKSLLAANADVNAKTDIGMTALMFAAVNGRLEVIQILLAAKADVNARGYKGVTALMLAAERGQLEVLKLLLAAHADAKATTVGGMTARCMCCKLATRTSHDSAALAFAVLDPQSAASPGAEDLLQ